MKIRIWHVVFLFILASCGKDDGLGSKSFYFSTYNGEAGIFNDQYYSLPNASVKAYSSAQSWLDGDAPILIFTTDSKGEYAANDKIAPGTVFFAEGMTFNNWPLLLSAELYVGDDGSVSGSAILYNTFFQNFSAVSGKNFLISDVLVNGVSVFASADACSKDNFIQLTKDAKIVYNEGANVCTGKSTSQKFDISTGKKSASETTVNGIAVWGLNVPAWTEVGGMVYIKKDFTQIMFKVNNGNEYVTVYTLQN